MAAVRPTAKVGTVYRFIEPAHSCGAWQIWFDRHVRVERLGDAIEVTVYRDALDELLLVPAPPLDTPGAEG